MRSYFSGDDRRKVGPLLRETQRIDHVVPTRTRWRPRCTRSA